MYLFLYIQEYIRKTSTRVTELIGITLLFESFYTIMNIFEAGKTSKALDSDSVWHRCKIIYNDKAGVRVHFQHMSAEWDHDFDSPNR